MWEDKPGTIGSNKVRQDSNLRILDLLRDFFVRNPSLRFHQGLHSLFSSKDKFNEESLTTLDLLKQQESIYTEYPLPWTIYVVKINNYSNGTKTELRTRYYKNPDKAWEYLSTTFHEMLDSVDNRYSNVESEFVLHRGGKITTEFFDTYFNVHVVYTSDTEETL